MCFRQPARELAKNNAKRIFIKEASRAPYGVEMKKAKSGGSQSGRVRKNPSFIYLSPEGEDNIYKTFTIKKIVNIL